MKKILLPLVFVFTWNLMMAQAPEIIWSKTYGGNCEDNLYKIIPGLDNTYIIAGNTVSFDLPGIHDEEGGPYPPEDLYVAKLNINGDTIWTKLLGGNGDELFRDILLTSNGNMIISSNTNSHSGDVHNYHGKRDAWFAKLNETGDTIWAKSFGGSEYESPMCMINTFDGNILIGCISASNDGDVRMNHGSYDIWILKLNNNSGDTLRTRILGGSNYDVINSIIQTSDSCFLIGGYSYSNDGDVNSNRGLSDLYIIKLNKWLDTIWTRTFGGSNHDAGIVNIIETSTGEFIISAKSNSSDGDIHGSHGDYDWWFLRMDSNGDTIWTKTLGGSKAETLRSVIITSESDIIAVGTTKSSDGDVHQSYGNNYSEDIWIVKLDNNGDTAWTKTIGGSDSETVRNVIKTHKDHILIAATTTSIDGDVFGNHSDDSEDFWLIKMNTSGDTLWTKALGGSDFEETPTVIQDEFGDYVVAGTTASNDGDIEYLNEHEFKCWASDFWVVKLERDECTGQTIYLKDSKENLLSGGSLQYREGGGSPWQTATEIEDGLFCIDTEREQVALRMTYNGQTKQVNAVPTNADYTFQTTLVTFELRKRTGELGYNNGEVSYASGDLIGLTGDDGQGILQKEMFPGVYSFRMKYKGGMQDITQDVSVDHVVSWQMARMLVQLNKSNGTRGLNGAVINYRGFAYEYFGVTGEHENGRARKDLLPGTYKFTIKYLGGKQVIEDFEVTQGNNELIIGGVATTVELLDSNTGDPVDGGKARNIGYTGNIMGYTGDNGPGIVTVDLLPVNYNFELTYDGDMDTQYDIDVSSSPWITFYTGDLKSRQSAVFKNSDLVIYPNPFTYSTNIAFVLARECEVSLLIFDINGNLVTELQNGLLPEGNHKIEWKSKETTRGIYFVQFTTSEKTMTKRIVKL